MVHFAVPPAAPATPKEGEAPPPVPPVELQAYIARLHDLAGEMGNIEDGPITVDTKMATEKFEEAVKATQATLLKLDDTGQDLLTPLLMNPLKDAHRAVVRHAGGTASGLWEVQVWPAYRDKSKTAIHSTWRQPGTPHCRMLSRSFGRRRALCGVSTPSTCGRFIPKLGTTSYRNPISRHGPDPRPHSRHSEP